MLHVEYITPKITKILTRVRVAEIQAIAIYEAEIYLARTPERKKLLHGIYDEEIEHDEILSRYANPSSFEVGLNRVVGWLVGGVLSLLPWTWLCRIQSWAENEAAKIYESGLGDVRAEWKRIGVSGDFLLESALYEASVQEKRHSEQFKTRKIPVGLCR